MSLNLSTSDFIAVRRMALAICLIRLLNLGSHFITTEENNIHTESWLTKSVWISVLLQGSDLDQRHF